MKQLKITALLMSLLLAACGGGGGGYSDGDGDGGDGGGSPAGSVYRLGVLDGGAFSSGTIAVSQSPLAAGGSSGLRVDIVDTAHGNALVTDSISVVFSSQCVSQNTASVSPNPVLTSTGSAAATYSALGCAGDDVITATATIGGSTITASGTIRVQAAPPSAIQFSSATPNNIRIKGTGDPQTSVVKFTLTNSAGGPVPGQSVRFTLDTAAGGITLAPTTGTSNTSGVVQTTVSSGTVATSVRVTATIVDSSGNPVAGIPPAQSDSLVISTGLADQDSFSISVGCFNIEGGDYDGTTTNVNILAADRFNNPVPDGTAISFRAEGGQVQPQCLTTGGGCSVNFASSNPRTSDHRVTILATAVGEESFTDANGNGRYNSGEAFVDLGEAFLDKNENSVRDSDEEFIDFNNSGNFDAPSGNFTGVLCDSGCDSATSLSVRNSVPIIMSGSVANIVGPSTIDLSNGAKFVQFAISDSANQPMPGGTKIEAITSFGSVVGDASYTQACSTFNGPFSYGFVVKPPDNQTTSTSGVFTVKVTTPKGVVTSASATVIYTVGSTTTPPPAGPLQSISFVSATPTAISIKGTGVGQPETSTVVFKVLDNKGDVKPDQTVTFALDTTVGGITLDRTSAVSASDGTVSVAVSSGTVHTTVRVTATATSGTTTVNARSDALTISTGIPDQDSFSLAADVLNIEGQNRDGVKSILTVRLADRFNNPVPDGTAVSFRTEGGSVEPQCTTSGGACSVTFTSQNPRVSNHRYTILATAIGEESFTDLNGNGAFDAGESFGDIAEPFLDRNENRARDPSTEEFVDFNGNGVFDPVSGNFTGPLCRTGCDTAKTLFVNQDIVIVMSGSTATITPSSTALTLSATSSVSFDVVIQDSAQQNMAAGTAIAATTDYGTIAEPASYTQQDSTFNGRGTPNTYSFTLVGSGCAGSGNVTITTTTPSGFITRKLIPVTATGIECVGGG
jgi:hypothetical protein